MCSPHELSPQAWAVMLKLGLKRGGKTCAFTLACV